MEDPDDDRPDYGRRTVAILVAAGVVFSPFFVPDDAPPDYAPGEVGAKVAQITFGSTTVNSAQPEMENTVIGRNFNVISPDPAYRVAAFVRGRAVRYVVRYMDVTSGST